MPLKMWVPLEAHRDVISSFSPPLLFPDCSILNTTPADYQSHVFIELTAVIPLSPSGVLIAHLEFIIMQVMLFFSNTSLHIYQHGILLTVLLLINKVLLQFCFTTSFSFYYPA